MCGGNNNNNNESTNRRTVITDEYTFETTNETTVRYPSCPPPQPPPKPVFCTCPPPPPQPICFCPPPAVRYEPPRYIPLKRCPSLTSVVTVNFPACESSSSASASSSIRRSASIKRVDNCETNTVVTLVNLPLNPPRPSRSRSRSRLCINEDGQTQALDNDNNKLVRSTSFTYKSNENLNDLSFKYDFEETVETPAPAPAPKPIRIECTCPPPQPAPQRITICTCPPPPCPKPNPCPLPVYPSICPPKQQAPPKEEHCSCKTNPDDCPCKGKGLQQQQQQKPREPECTCPKPQQTRITFCTCPPPPCPPRPNPCPLPSYPSICNKNTDDTNIVSSKSFSNSNVETTTSLTTTTTTTFDDSKKIAKYQKNNNITNNNGQNNHPNSLTYVYNDSDGDRQVTYIRHTDNDPGLSLPGCLVRASETNLPVTRSVNLGAIFNGSSFGLLTESIFIRDSFELSFDFRTNAKNAIMAIVVDDNTKDSFFIELYDSQLKSTLYINGEADSCWTDFPSKLLSNDIWINVNVILNNNKMCLTVKNNFYTKQHRCQLKSPIRGDLFVAGHPSTVDRPFVCRSKSFFVGEMRNFNVNNNGVKWYGTPSSKSVRLRNWY